MAKFHLYVDDNYHHGNEEDRYLHGTYDTYEEAVAAAENILDDFFSAVDVNGMTEEQLFSGWAQYGDNPFIVSEDKEYAEKTMADAMATLSEMQRRIEVYGTSNLAEIFKPIDLGSKRFSASEYARQCCKKLCSG